MFMYICIYLNSLDNLVYLDEVNESAYVLENNFRKRKKTKTKNQLILNGFFQSKKEEGGSERGQV